MSKTIIHRIETRTVPYEKTVHEHKAPTDESVKLLNEMQKAALDNIVKTFNVNDNTVNACVIYLINKADFDGFKFVAKFTFNGKEHKIEGEILRHELIETSKYGSEKVALAIYKSMCFLIAQNVLTDAPGLREALNSTWR